MSGIKILNGGLLSTIQDFGRVGFKKFGMPSAGVMDGFSYQISQFLVQNKNPKAVIETTLMGVEIEFLQSMSVAVTGAENELYINGNKVSLWHSHEVNAGDILKLGVASKGVRNYIAFSKEMDIKSINGSQSTYLKSGIGGLEGRALRAGDMIDFLPNHKVYKSLSLPHEEIPYFSQELTVRVVMGPEDGAFSEGGIKNFLGSPYSVSQRSDRMGYRLDGEKIEHKKGADILSNATSFGPIQVPNDGQPIVLMADAQTTGGYTKIATVIKADLYKLAQLGSGGVIRFKSVSVNEAVMAYEAYIKEFVRLNGLLERKVHSYTININNKKFKVTVEEIV